MFFFRACPSCHGNLYLESDDYGTFVEYLQCGLCGTRLTERSAWLTALSTSAARNRAHATRKPSRPRA